MSADAISSILSQIRSLQSQVAAPGASSSEAVAGAQPGGFAATLSKALSAVNDKQAEAGRVAQAFEMGDPRADLVKVMVATQESQVAFRATVEVRNRLVQAYQDIMNMPL